MQKGTLAGRSPHPAETGAGSQASDGTDDGDLLVLVDLVEQLMELDDHERAGIEPATLGLKVRPKKLRPSARS